MSMKDCKPDGSCSKSANSKAKCDSAKCKMNGGDKVQPMSCCKGKVESTTTSQTGCTSSCTMMKSKSESK
jgi:hypothetical protein